MTKSYKLRISYDEQREIEYHNKLKQIAINAYGKSDAKLPEDIFELCPELHLESGLDAMVLSDGINVIVAFRGTEFDSLDGIKKDVPDDIAIFFNKVPQQAKEAEQLCRWIKEQYPDMNITVTGHSLGGGIGTYAAAKNGLEAVVFNPIGSAGLINSGEKIDDSQIINYCNPRDPIPSGLPNEHLGQCYEINSKGFTNRAGAGIQHHRIEDMEDLRTRQPISKEELSKQHKRYMQETPRYLDTAIESFKETFGINKLHEVLSNCPGSYNVSGYTRVDGKKIDSYVRSCGFHK